ncbi:anaphase-promoting complex subunit 2-like isoform X4 [Beta vulgaris subsp. vulgaris]|uniref:anaphase-promoting complex subunit 2-like isoform X4 n=1 Tax=Beta vulgaris subsp. vulgaris TaxID=3555 RepID=UPI002036806A|nr:anaphase-promoting complex subunit 2-like isoform X4 [Beta vulgaris subsp. vulgaris]XP_048495089.1 anaphase-promoting complex subunit 2-like isoform X4 [Beta vulgaris subsp. vulgaris]
MLKSLLRLEDHRLCDYGLRSLVEDHFLQSLEVTFETTGASRFWKHFDAYVGGSISMNEESRLEESLYRALAEMSLVKQCQDRSLLMLVHSLQSHRDGMSDSKYNSNIGSIYLLSKYQQMFLQF